jgi:hypothetical protein
LLLRYADDAELNAYQKEQERWNDPAAAFLTVRNIHFIAGRVAYISFVLWLFLLTPEKRKERSEKAIVHGTPSASESIWD